MSVHSVPSNLVSPFPDVSTIDGIRVLGQTEVSIEVDWQNPQAEMDYFRLTHTDPEGQEEELKVQRSQEARTKHTIVGESYKFVNNVQKYFSNCCAIRVSYGF